MCAHVLSHVRLFAEVRYVDCYELTCVSLKYIRIVKFLTQNVTVFGGRITREIKLNQVVLVVKNLPANAGNLRDMGSILGSGRSPGGGHSNQLQHSCLENPMDSGAWWAMVHTVSKNWT